jgi:hypothetical protein
MSNQTNKPNVVSSKTPAEIAKLDEQQRLDRVANEAAAEAGKTEQRYDQDNGIFTK